jgi:hypothetical protein
VNGGYKMLLTIGLTVVVLVVAAVLAVQMSRDTSPAAPAEPDHGNTHQQLPVDTEYWTDERMRKAVPPPMEATG